MRIRDIQIKILNYLTQTTSQKSSSPPRLPTVYTQVLKFHLMLGFVVWVWAVGLHREARHCEEERRRNRKNHGIMRLLRSAIAALVMTI